MNTPLSIAEILLIASTIGGAIAWLLKFHSDKRKENAEAGKIDVETFVLLREQVGEMEEKIVQLRDRVDALEVEKDETQKKFSDTLQKFNELKVYVRNLLLQLDTVGFQYEKPRPGLLDTGEHKAIK